MRHYHSFLLRIWQDVGEEDDQWAAKLVWLQTGQTLQLTTVDELLLFLRTLPARSDADPPSVTAARPAVSIDQEGDGAGDTTGTQGILQ